MHAPGPDFGALARHYDDLRPADANWWEVFHALVTEGELLGRRVLDVGCGTGRFAHELSGRGARVWGVDPSDEMLAEARARGPLAGGGFKRARAERLPFRAVNHIFRAVDVHGDTAINLAHGIFRVITIDH